MISPPMAFASPMEAFVLPTAVGPVSTTNGFFFILYNPLEFLFQFSFCHCDNGRSSVWAVIRVVQ